MLPLPFYLFYTTSSLLVFTLAMPNEECFERWVDAHPIETDVEGGEVVVSTEARARSHPDHHHHPCVPGGPPPCKLRGGGLCPRVPDTPMGPHGAPCLAIVLLN